MVVVGGCHHHHHHHTLSIIVKVLLFPSHPTPTAIVRAAQACDLAMIVPKGVDSFPQRKGAQMTGSVDVWCVVHDGGLLLLVSYLLLRNRVWRKCELHVFVVASDSDDTVNLKKNMDKFMYDLRINATVDVVALVSGAVVVIVVVFCE